MITIQIKTDNAAFHDEGCESHHSCTQDSCEPELEVARILGDLAMKLNRGELSSLPRKKDANLLLDVNGNCVGQMWESS